MLAESYRVLQVPFGADMPQIRQAYRQLVLQYHPDRNSSPGAQEMFLRIQAAYEYLQQHQTVSRTSTFTQKYPPKAPLTPEQEWEKYQYVYEPPSNPEEYAAWARVGRERVRRQKEKDHLDYVRRTLAMKKKWWYGLARAASYLVLWAGRLTGLVIALIAFPFAFGDRPHIALLAFLLIPVGWRILDIMRVFREDIRKHFGEDLTEEQD